jgi:hypothetical protein
MLYEKKVDIADSASVHSISEASTCVQVYRMLSHMSLCPESSSEVCIALLGSCSLCVMLLPIVEKMIIVLGHLLLRRIIKIKGLQGMMIDREAMMTGEVLTLIMIIIGTTALHEINQIE